MSSSWKRALSTMAGIAAAVVFAAGVFGQERDEYGDVVQQTVARISHVQGAASYARGDQPDDWQPADANVPLTLGDRLYTDDHSRLELEVQGGDVIRIGAQTDLTALNLTEDTKQFALKSGIGSFQIHRLDEDDTWEVDTPNSAVTFEQPGDYRIDVDRDGNTRVSVRRGAAAVAAGGGQLALRAGEAITVDGIDAPRYDLTAVRPPDSWDQWVDNREGRVRSARSYQYVSASVVGADDLDEYGRWEQIPTYGWVWTPAAVDAGWAPYRVGQWCWQDPWGWTWVSAEPWGWAPYHYGRWVTWSSRWYWVPVAPSVRVVAYAPALVAFVGAGPGFSATVTVGGGGFVGWFPLAPQDPLIPWWQRGPTVQVTHITYVNRTYVTVVPEQTFVSGQVVTRSIVTDRTVVREVAAAPVIRGTMPIIPTVASTRVSIRTNVPAPRPPAAVVSRSVVARVAPPPAPPSFQQKLVVIRENRGAPVAASASARMAAAERTETRAATTVRPVTTEAGRVTLAPVRENAPKTQRVEPVAPVRGRPMATAAQPVAPGPVTGSKSRERAAAASRAAQEPQAPAKLGERPPAPPTASERPGRETAPERQPLQATPAPSEPPSRGFAPEQQRSRPTSPPQERPGRELVPERRPPTPSEERSRPRPTAPEPENRPGQQVAPQRARVPTPPALRERQQPEERIAPEPRPTRPSERSHAVATPSKPAQKERGAKPAPTKRPTKDEDKKDEKPE